MKLLTMHLRNFKGARKVDIEPNGENLTAFGDNATGKTTIVDAFTWLLFGKDSQNRTDFEVKTLDKSGAAESGVDHSVEAVFDVDGRRLTLKRTLSEQWTKPRGSAKRVFTGHKTEYHVDEVPVKKGEFDDRVAQLADEKRFRLLSDPMYFNTVLHWKERRAILVEACGDVSDEEVIASDPGLAELPQIVGDHSLDDYRKIVDQRKREANKELEALPVRIDEVREGMPLVTGSRRDAEAALADARTERRRLEEHLSSLRSGGGAAELRQKLADLDAQMLEKVTEVRSLAESQAHEARQAYNALVDKTHGARREVERLTEERVRVARSLEESNRERESLREQFIQIRQGTPPSLRTDEAVCPTCGQPLRSSAVAEAHEKAVARFNADQAERLERIRERGHNEKAVAEKLEHRLADLDAALAEAQEAHRQVQSAASEAERKAQSLARAIPDPEQNAAYVQLKAEKDALLQRRADLEATVAEEIAEAEAKIREVDEVLQERTAALAAFDQVERDEKRIEELKGRERDLSGRIEELEGHLFLIEQFTRAKVSLLDEKINSRFERARFKLFEEQINEGVKEACITTFDGVPFDSLNHGARLNVGLDIINTLTEHFGFAPPVFIDNAESVTSILPTRGQAIRLVVSANDKRLRFETLTKL